MFKTEQLGKVLRQSFHVQKGESRTWWWYWPCCARLLLYGFLGVELSWKVSERNILLCCVATSRARHGKYLVYQNVFSHFPNMMFAVFNPFPPPPLNFAVSIASCHFFLTSGSISPLECVITLLPDCGFYTEKVNVKECRELTCSMVIEARRKFATNCCLLYLVINYKNLGQIPRS